MLEQLGTMGRYLGQSLRLMVGLPDYQTYVAHMEATHPDREPMTYEAFFRERQEARYGGGRGKMLLIYTWHARFAQGGCECA